MGTGTRDIVAQCKAIGLRDPEFIQEENFRIILWRKEKRDETINEPTNPAKSTDSELDKFYWLADEPINEPIKKELVLIIDLVLSNPGISRSELFERAGKSLATIKRYVKILNDYNIIERKGSNKTGGYHLTNEAKAKLE